MSSALSADDPFCYPPDGLFKANATQFCFVDRIDKEPSAFISIPRHDTKRAGL